MRSLAALAVFSALLPACASTSVESGDVCPTATLIAPTAAKPVRLAIEGLHETYVPTGEDTSFLEYNVGRQQAYGRPPAAVLSAVTPSGEPTVGVKILWEPRSGTEEITIEKVRAARVIYGEGEERPLESLRASITPSGVRLEGSALIDGMARRVVVEGPLYRECVRYADPPGGERIDPTETPVVSDPEFNGPCAPFRD